MGRDMTTNRSQALATSSLLGGQPTGDRGVPLTIRSVFYGKPVSSRAFPSYTTAELERDLQSKSLDAATRAKIETEVARRKAGLSKHKVTPQIGAAS